MKTRALDTTIATLFHAPDTEQSPAGGSSPAPAVPAESSPTGQAIPAAPERTQPKTTVVQPEPVKAKGIVDVKKAFGLDRKPSEMNKDAAKDLANRSRSDTVIPAPKIKSAKITPEPKAADPKPEDQQQKQTEPVAPVVAKVKIGDKEMTPDEVAEHIAELEKKAAAQQQAPEPRQAEPKADEGKAKTPEEIAAEEKRLDEEFLASLAKNYEPTEEELDIILSGGKKATELFAKRLAAADYGVRKWVEQSINPILDRLNPVLQQHALIEQYQNEAQFLTEYPDLSPHFKTARTIEQTLSTKYPKEFTAMTPKERREEVAKHTRAFIKEFGITATPAAPTATPAAEPTAQAAPKPAPQPRPKPPTGQVGSGSSPSTINPQAAMVQKLMQSGK